MSHLELIATEISQDPLCQDGRLILWQFHQSKVDGFVEAKITFDKSYIGEIAVDGGLGLCTVYTTIDRRRFDHEKKNLNVDFSSTSFGCHTSVQKYEENAHSIGRLLQEVSVVTDAHPCSCNVGFRDDGTAIAFWKNDKGRCAGAFAVFEGVDDGPCGWCITCRSRYELSESAISNWVYFIQSGQKGPIKIGRSADVNARASDLQTANPEKLTILARVPGGPVLEKILHAQFSAFRIRGEWFRPSDEIITLIREMGRKT